MYSTAALMLVNAHIGDLIGEADRERLADLVRASSTRKPKWHAARETARLGARARRLLQVLRALSRAPAN